MVSWVGVDVTRWMFDVLKYSYVLFGISARNCGYFFGL